MVKSCFICVLVMCMLEADAVVPFSSVKCTRTPDCPLFNLRSDIVTLDDLRNEVEGAHWIPMYYTEFVPKQTFGKCILLWHPPNAYNVVRRQTMCYNFALQNCHDFEVNVTRKEMYCGRAEENAVNTVMDAKFYSQDITHYFWYDQCYQYNYAHECTVRFLVLMIKKLRVRGTKQQEELDLQSMPWDLIAADMKNNFDLSFSDPHVKFNHLEPECGFDGRVIRKPYQPYQNQPHQYQPYQYQPYQYQPHQYKPYQYQPYQYQPYQYQPYQYRRKLKNKHNYMRN